MLPEAIEEVYEKIKSEILNNTYQSGQALTEIPLAQKYGIKRARIRQVIQKLENDSLVTRIPGKGAFIKSITSKDFRKIFEVRIALEAMAAKLSARRRNENDLDKMIQLFEKDISTLKEEELYYKKRIGQKLHHFILKSCENEMIVEAIEPLKMQIMIIWQDRVTFNPNRINESFEEHKALLVALKNRDENLAENIMKEHISNAFKDYVSTINKLEE